MDRSSSNHRIKIPDNRVEPLQGEPESVKSGPRNGEGFASKKYDGPELPNRNETGSPSVERTNKTKSSTEGKKSNQKFKKAPVKGKPVPDEVPDSVQSASGSCQVASEVDVSSLKGCQTTSPGSEQCSESLKENSGCSHHGDPTEGVKDGSWSFDSLVSRALGASALSILRGSSEWIESKRPLLMTITTILSGFGHYTRLQAEKAYPVVCRWLVHFGNLILLISMIWLDCSVRGLVSFLRLGTTSFFAIVWCSILSVIAMVGTSKFLIILGAAALATFFVGLTLAALVVSILATVFLWMYGSFWTTGLVTLVGGLAFTLHYERFALLLTTIYSVYCAKTYVGWLGLFLGLNFSFISSDVLVHFLKSNIHEHNRFSRSHEETSGMRGPPGSFFSEPMHASPSETSGISADRSSGDPSTSGVDAELTSEDEVIRLLSCTDHYSALGLSRYENVDVSLLKREYRRKAMLVHPDKNMGNEKAAEAFKKLQNAYEVLLDSLKRKAYDDELRREELLNWFRRSQSSSQKNGKNGLFSGGFTASATDSEDLHEESRRIACKKCGNFHIWVHTSRSKSRARWCQECNDFHQAKDGDGWVEQSSQPFLFGLLQKVDAPTAYICAESRIYDATEWFVCQGMRCPANAHKPSFHVNTSVTSKQQQQQHSWNKGRGGIDMEEIMTEEEFIEWLQRAMQSGAFEGGGSPSTDKPFSGTGNFSKSGGGGGGSGSSKKKKKGKKQW